MAPTSKSYHLFVWSRELRGLSSIRSIPQMLPNFFCEGPCSKYFKICRPHSLCSNYFMLQYEASCLLFSCEVMSNSLWCHGLQHTRLLFHSLSPRVPSNSYPLSQWCYLTISSCATLFSFHLQSYPASGSFQWVSSWHVVVKVLELQLQHQSFQWIFRVDFLYNWLVWSPCSPRDSQESSPAPHFESINSLAPSLLYGPTITSIHDYWESHSFNYMALC